jgi:hypothetical protein
MTTVPNTPDTTQETVAVVAPEDVFTEEEAARLERFIKLRYSNLAQFGSAIVRETTYFLVTYAATPGRTHQLPASIDIGVESVILDTMLYEAVCQRLGVPRILHQPLGDFEADEALVAATMAAVREAGHPINTEIWEMDINEPFGDFCRFLS